MHKMESVDASSGGDEGAERSPEITDDLRASLRSMAKEILAKKLATGETVNPDLWALVWESRAVLDAYGEALIEEIRERQNRRRDRN